MIEFYVKLFCVLCTVGLAGAGVWYHLREHIRPQKTLTDTGSLRVFWSSDAPPDMRFWDAVIVEYAWEVDSLGAAFKLWGKGEFLHTIGDSCVLLVPERGYAYTTITGGVTIPWHPVPWLSPLGVAWIEFYAQRRKRSIPQDTALEMLHILAQRLNRLYDVDEQTQEVYLH